jgi:hypothetical protein
MKLISDVSELQLHTGSGTPYLGGAFRVVSTPTLVEQPSILGLGGVSSLPTTNPLIRGFTL